ncbi:hypothetical protein HanRHA438_Chr10g0470201 [Helianthus annuus]|nr:hypothetical protein HanRHA438_Chr10g0470201 [Helianthus annuus]
MIERLSNYEPVTISSLSGSAASNYRSRDHIIDTKPSLEKPKSNHFGQPANANTTVELGENVHDVFLFPAAYLGATLSDNSGNIEPTKPNKQKCFGLVGLLGPALHDIYQVFMSKKGIRTSGMSFQV